MFPSFFKILPACLAGQDWVQNFTLVLLGLRTPPKEDSDYAPAEALLGTRLAVPGEFLDAPDLPLTDFLQNIFSAITRFPRPVPHHTLPAPAKPLPKTLLSSGLYLYVKILLFPLPLYCILDHTKLRTEKINISNYRLVLSKITFQSTG